MTDQTIAKTEAPKTEDKTVETVRVSGNISPELNELLFENHRYDARQERRDYLNFVLTEYAAGRSIKNTVKSAPKI